MVYQTLETAFETAQVHIGRLETELPVSSGAIRSTVSFSSCAIYQLRHPVLKTSATALAERLHSRREEEKRDESEKQVNGLMSFPGNSLLTYRWK